MSRPEYLAAPEVFYNDVQAAKYTANSHIMSIQSEMTRRAFELLALQAEKPCLLLDIGCGSGLSGEILSEFGHEWIGLDISEAMLEVAREAREVDGDLVRADMGCGLPFLPGSFDGAISISAVQWLCHSNSVSEIPRKRLLKFFQSLYACLGRGSRAVLQFYPETTDQSELISAQAMRAGFSGGIVIDYPNSTKAKKLYLVLMTGGMQQLPLALMSDADYTNHVPLSERRTIRNKRTNNRKKSGVKAWIEAKKEKSRKRGKEVCNSSKYTGRKRRSKF